MNNPRPRHVAPRMADPLARLNNDEARRIVHAFNKHQTNTETIPGAMVSAEVVWSGPVPGLLARVRLRTSVDYTIKSGTARGQASVWMPDRGWVPMLPPAPLPAEAQIVVSAQVTHVGMVEAANEHMLVAAVAFLREDSTVGS